MFEKLEGPTKIGAYILLFPVFFQGHFLYFAWGANDPLWLTCFKRTLILLPTLALIFACWVTIMCSVSLIVRANRRAFASAIFVTWWELGRSIFAYWGGILKFLFYLFGWIGGVLRIVVFGLLLCIKDIILLPLRILNDFTNSYSNPGVPWPAVILIFAWCLLEALIFTFVMAPVVIDVLSGIAGVELGGPSLFIPLYLTFFVFALGSYAVLQGLGDAIQSRDWGKIIYNFLVELVVAAVESFFLYREFVDALVPWFAQHAGDDFELGIMGTLSIAFFVWLGIRAMTWFLFGASGVPVMLALIQRTGIKNAYPTSSKSSIPAPKDLFVFVSQSIDKIKQDMDWVHAKGDELLSAFLVPPLQILAASINFCTLFLSSSHLFELPFKGYRDILDARTLMLNAKTSATEK